MISRDLVAAQRTYPFFVIVGLGACLAVLTAAPAHGWRLHARTVEYQGTVTSCDKKTYHSACTVRTRECLSSDYPVWAWAHASGHKSCRLHLDTANTVGAYAHAHHGPHSTSACMKGSIEDRYAGDDRSSAPVLGSADGSDETIPASLTFAIEIPPPRDGQGNLAYASVEVDSNEAGGIRLRFAPRSKLQLDSRSLGPDRVGVLALRVCVADEEGKRLDDGLVELTVGEGDQRLRKSGLFETMDLRVAPHSSYDGVWVVDLGSANLTVDWLSLDDEFELLVENAGLDF